MFDQSRRHLTKSPNIEKWLLQYGTDNPVKPLKSASSARSRVNMCVFLFFVCVSDTFCSAAACQMSRLQTLWQIGMLRLWFQPGYVNPLPTPMLCTSRKKKISHLRCCQRKLLRVLEALRISSPPPPPSPAGSPGEELRELQEEVRWCFSVHVTVLSNQFTFVSRRELTEKRVCLFLETCYKSCVMLF